MNAGDPIEELKALAHPLRMRILQALTGGERNVGEIEEATGIAQPALSQQLAVLRNAGLVDTRKQAKLVFYSLNADRFAHVAAVIGELGGVSPASKSANRRAATGVANFARLS